MTATVVDAGDGLPLTIPALIRRWAREQGDRVFAIVDDKQITYAEADARSRRMARGLLAAGVRKGSHVGLLMPNGIDFVVCVLAIARIGAVLLPFSTLSTADELRGLMKNSDTGFVIAATEFRSHRYPEVLKNAFPELDLTKPPALRNLTAPWLRGIWFNGALPAGSDRGWSLEALEASGARIDEKYLDAVEARVLPSDRFVIVHTSGSTSLPKGVIHQHGPLIRHLNNLNAWRSLVPEDRMFTTAPWFWVAGFGYSLIGSLVAGSTVAFTNATVATDILDFIERVRPTISSGVWQGVAKLTQDPSFAKRDFSLHRRGTLHPIMPSNFRPRDPSLRHDVYGMSEVGGALTYWAGTTDLPEHMRGSCGKILPGFEPRIVHPDTGKDCADGEPGELWLRGPFMMEGYYGRHRSEYIDRDGWWRSGDVVTIDADGFVYLKGRLGDMIKSAGANVSPREVEAVLTDLAGTQSIVLGVPDKDRGQVVAAIVVTDKDIDEAKLREQLAAKLSSYKVPRRILRFSQPEVPLLASGKLDLRKLVEVVQARW